MVISLLMSGGKCTKVERAEDEKFIEMNSSRLDTHHGQVMVIHVIVYPDPNRAALSEPQLGPWTCAIDQQDCFVWHTWLVLGSCCDMKNGIWSERFIMDDSISIGKLNYPSDKGK
jgi:hypothetical protein